MSEQKTGAIRLFNPHDEGTSLHGWRALNRNPLQGFVNEKGWACLHVVVQKIGEGAVIQDLYDQVVIIENPGAIVVCRQGTRVGLIRSFRFTANRLPELEALQSTYIRSLSDQGEFERVLATLGRWQWELPRGLSPEASGNTLRRFILNTAEVEASQEGGFEIHNAHVCGRINPNSTFFAHPQYVVVGEVERVGKNKPEDLELIGKAQMFEPHQIRELVQTEELDDGLTLGALALAGVHF